jgi:hypothetical protein
MAKRLILGVLVAIVAVSVLLAVWLLRGGDDSTGAQGDTVEMGIDPEVTGNTASTLGTLEDCVRVDVESPAFDGVSDYNVDIYVQGDTQAPVSYDAWVTYDATKVHIASPDTSSVIKLPGASAFSDALPDTDGRFIAGAAYLSGGPGIAGDGTLVRLGLDIGGAGLVTFDFDPEPSGTAYLSLSGEEFAEHPISRRTAQLAINEDCPRGAGPEPSPTSQGRAQTTPTLSPTATPRSEAGGCPAPNRVYDAPAIDMPDTAFIMYKRLMGGVRYSEGYVTVDLPEGREFAVFGHASPEDSVLYLDIWDVKTRSALSLRGRDGCEGGRVVRDPAAEAAFDEIMRSLRVGSTYVCPSSERKVVDRPQSDKREGAVEGGGVAQLGPLTLHLPAGRGFWLGKSPPTLPGGTFFTVSDAQTGSQMSLRADGCEVDRRVADPAADAVFDEILATLEAPSR